MDKHQSITPEYLRKRLRYDESTGKLFWLYGERDYFSSDKGWNIFNAKYPDREAFTHVNSWGYLCGGVSGKLLLAHRVIWAICHDEWPNGEIDHIDGDKLNNKIENLRDVSGVTNRRNMPKQNNNTSGYTGVNLKNGKWVARIGAGKRGGRIHLGRFNTIDEAIAARKDAEKRLGYSKTHGRD